MSHDVHSSGEFMEPKQRLNELIDQSLAKLKVTQALSIRLYFRSGREILRMANIYADEGDEERAFQLYHRFASLFLCKILEHPDYRSADPKEKAFFKSKTKDVTDILPHIKQSLLTRYQKEYEEHLKQAEDRKKQERDQNTRRAQTTFVVADQTDDSGIEARFREAQQRLSQIKFDPRPCDAAEWANDVPASAPPFPSSSSPSSSSPCPQERSISFDKSISNYIPAVDRSTKPDAANGSDSLRRVLIPMSLSQDFLRAAAANTARNVETCGILAGKLSQNVFTITHVLIPKQRGTSDSCLTDNEEEVFAFQDTNNLTTLGWIHTHPTQTAFLSSIDLHTHFSYQIMLAEAIAIVCAPKFQATGIFSLTPDFGLDFIANCNQPGFHPHPNESLIYHSSPHVHFDANRETKLVDLR